MTCKDNCIHYKVCKHFIKDKRVLTDDLKFPQQCFEDKSKFIKLPCVAMIEQEITADCKFNHKSVSKNGRTAVVYIDKSKGFNLPLVDITNESYKYDTAKQRIRELKEKK